VAIALRWGSVGHLTCRQRTREPAARAGRENRRRAPRCFVQGGSPRWTVVSRWTAQSVTRHRRFPLLLSAAALGHVAPSAPPSLAMVVPGRTATLSVLAVRATTQPPRQVSRSSSRTKENESRTLSNCRPRARCLGDYRLRAERFLYERGRDESSHDGPSGLCAVRAGVRAARPTQHANSRDVGKANRNCDVRSAGPPGLRLASPAFLPAICCR
jgi:hypothetical protein